MTTPRPVGVACACRGFLDHWESYYDFTLTKIHCDVSHRCIARKFLLLLGAKTFSGNYAHCEPGSSSIERDSGCVADGSIVLESKAVLKDGACIPFLWSSNRDKSTPTDSH